MKSTQKGSKRILSENSQISITSYSNPEFTKLLSHDLRAPLRSIDYLSRWLEEDLAKELTGESLEYLRLLRAHVKDMEEMITAVMRYSGSGSLDEPSTTFPIQDLLHSIISIVDPEKQFEISFPKNLCPITSKKMKLRHVLLNLLENAVSHHDKLKGNISVEIESQEGILFFSVSDDGPGILKKDHEKIFHLFQTSSDNLNSTRGIGLAIVKRIVEENGGSISIESAPGEGSTFRFSWPLANPLQPVEN